MLNKCSVLTDWLENWLCECCLIDVVTYWPTGSVNIFSVWRTRRQTDQRLWLVLWRSDWLTNWPFSYSYWQTSQPMTIWLRDWLTGSMISWLAPQQRLWLADWLGDKVADSFSRKKKKRCMWRHIPHIHQWPTFPWFRPRSDTNCRRRWCCMAVKTHF